MEINSRQVECFLKAAEVLNFSTVAESLYISKSAVSRMIKNLEDEIGVPLFIRMNNVIRMTRAGEIMYESFSRMHTDLKADIKRAQEVECQNKRILKISLGGEIMFDLLWELYFRAFEENNPNLMISYEYRNPYRTNYDDDDANLIFVHGYSKDLIKDRKGKHLLTGECFFWVFEEHPIAKRGYIVREDFEMYPVVTMYDENKYLNIHRGIFEYYNVTPSEVIVVPSVQQQIIKMLRLNAIASGDNYTYQLDNRFVRIPVPEEFRYTAFYVFWNEKDDDRGELIELIIREIQELAAEYSTK